ncbi:MAG: TonB-dependent receptor [Steroidobacteraceae bacterium]|jgi:outer membrane receptor protein involved in Fe transport
MVINSTVGRLHWVGAIAVAAFPAWAAASAAAGVYDPSELTEIVVTATLRSTPAIEVPASVTVLSDQTLRDAGRTHFEDVLGLIPNLNWAGDTSLPRYFQLRGIGELEQYQGAPNPSVGFLIDDVDFSGLGTAGTLYDIDQVDVLRGPQPTRYGANALAGLIYLKSAEPTDTWYGRVDLDPGDYGTNSQGAVLSGPVDSLDSGFRLAAQRFYTNGYYRNLYLNRDDTNRQDEYTYRAKWVFMPSDRLRIELTAMQVDIDNGYDAYAIDNSRDTESDQPGVDSQHSTGVALRAHYLASDTVGFTAIATYARSVIEYSYDGDWGNPVLWAPAATVYQASEVQNRERWTKTLELRLGTESNRGFGWLAGFYGSQLDERLTDLSLYDYQPLGAPPDPVADQSNDVIDSGYRARNVALFGELDGDFAADLRWSVGLRAERWSASYQGTTTDFLGTNTGYTNATITPTAIESVTPATLNPANDLWGGHTSLTYKIGADQSVYATVVRGYKAGGFNLSQNLLPSQLSFNPEADVSLETGYKADLLNHRLTINADVFYLYRRDAQIKTSFQSDPKNPDDFVFYTGNAASGHNDGVESDLTWRAADGLTLGADLGLLQSYFEDFVQQGSQGTTTLTVSRELANAPHWQAAANATYRDPRGPFARIDVTGMGGYYFDLPPNDTTSKPYGLLHAKVGWETPRWSVYLSGRNLLNKRYPVRGFYFGDVPPNFPNEVYIQLGDPRTWIASLSVNFGGAPR